MMRIEGKTNDFTGIRLATARWLSPLLFLWIMADNCWQEVFVYHPSWQFGGTNPYGILVIAAISLFMLTVLSPVLLRGRIGAKLFAALLAIFPLIVFVVATTWVFSCPRWGIIIIND